MTREARRSTLAAARPFSRAWVATAMASSMSSLVGPGLLLLGYSKLFRARRTLPNERNMRTVVPNCAVTSPAPLGARLGWLPVALAPQAGWPRSHARRHRPADRHRTDLLPPWPGTQWQGGGPRILQHSARDREVRSYLLHFSRVDHLMHTHTARLPAHELHREKLRLKPQGGAAGGQSVPQTVGRSTCPVLASASAHRDQASMWEDKQA